MHSSHTTKTTDNQTDEKEHRSDNSTYPKVAVQWLNQALCFYQSFCLVDSEKRPCTHAREHQKKCNQESESFSVLLPNEGEIQA
jgi:hypothetical protein